MACRVEKVLFDAQAADLANNSYLALAYTSSQASCGGFLEGLPPQSGTYAPDM